MDLPKMTVGQLVSALQNLPSELEVKVWLPGSRIKLVGVIGPMKKYDAVMIEGNIEPGSALGD